MTFGKQGGHLVPCSKSKHHGHHPAWEDCPMCEPVVDDFGTADTIPPWAAKCLCLSCGADNYEYDLICRICGSLL